jgi:hypothetical protein
MRKCEIHNSPARVTKDTCTVVVSATRPTSVQSLNPRFASAKAGPRIAFHFLLITHTATLHDKPLSNAYTWRVRSGSVIKASPKGFLETFLSVSQSETAGVAPRSGTPTDSSLLCAKRKEEKPLAVTAYETSIRDAIHFCVYALPHERLLRYSLERDVQVAGLSSLFHFANDRLHSH